jgi:hypothetical protein
LPVTYLLSFNTVRTAMASWAYVTATIAFVYFSTVALYRLFLHPLSKFPGPRLAAVTRYFEAYYDIICNGQYTFKIAEMHREYGTEQMNMNMKNSRLLKKAQSFESAPTRFT